MSRSRSRFGVAAGTSADGAARRRRPGPLDEGTTLVELLVVIGLLGILTSILSATAILGVRSVDGVQTGLDNATSSEVAMETITKLLRTAVLPGQLGSTCSGCSDNAVISASDKKVAFYANLDNTSQGPRRVTIEVVRDSEANNGTGVLVVTQQAPTVAADGSYSYCNPVSSGCPVSVRKVARGLVWPSPQVFTYVTFAGSSVAGSAVPSATLPQISSVDVYLEARSKTAARYTTAAAFQRVRLPNAEINARETTTP